MSATAVIGLLVKSHKNEPNANGSSPLIIAIVAMVPLYAWVSALKVSGLVGQIEWCHTVTHSFASLLLRSTFR